MSELKPSLEDLGYELEKTAAQRDALLEALRGFEATVCVAAKRGEGLGVLSVFSLHKRARAALAEGEGDAASRAMHSYLWDQVGTKSGPSVPKDTK